MLTFGFYFAFVSGLTIGYGDLAPKSLLTRTLAVLIGICGVLVTALVAAVAVKALTAEIGNSCRSASPRNFGKRPLNWRPAPGRSQAAAG
jgi:hypothetical protein